MNYALALLLLCSQLTGFTQKDSLTLYAYEQKVSPGIAPARDVEAAPNTRYIIFLAVPKNQKVTPVALWIKGKQYGVKVKSAETPIEGTADSTIILVPQTEQNVFRVFPSGTTASKGSGKSLLAKDNEILLAYKMNGRLHYLAKEKFTHLPPLHLQ